MSITQAQANTGTYSIPKIQGTAAKPNISGANGGNMIMSFLDMVQSKAKTQPAAVNNNAKTFGADKPDKSAQPRTDLSKTDGFPGLDRSGGETKEQISKISQVSKNSKDSKILNQDGDESEDTGVNGLTSILGLFEMLGIPQDIAQQMYDYFMPESDGGGKSDVMGLANLMSQTANDEIIPEDIRKILSDFSDKLLTVLTGAGAITEYDSKNIISGEEYIDLFQQPGTDFFSMLKKAATDYLTEKSGRIEAVNANAAQNPDSTPVIISILETDVGANISRGNQTETAASIGEIYKAMKKTAVDFRYTTVEIKTEDIGKDVVLSQQLTDEQGEELEASYASNLSLTTDEAAEILSKDPKTLANALSVPQTATDINKIPDSMHNLFNYALAGILNAENNENVMQAIQTAGGESVGETLEEISHIIANNIKNGVGINTAGDANKANTGGFELKMTLSPKELGELLIKVSYSKGNVVLNVVAANKAAEAGIINRIGDLKESLSLRGINLTDVEVNSGTLDYGGQSGYSNENAHAQNSRGNGSNHNHGGNVFSGTNGANSVQNSFETINKEAARHEIVMNYVRNQRLLYKTI